MAEIAGVAVEEQKHRIVITAVDPADPPSVESHPVLS
jgi:hypothetical protein